MSDIHITLGDLCQQLSISRATGRNWLRLGKIESQGKQPDGAVYFTEDYVRSVNEALRTGKRQSLRSRRNKGYVSGKCLYDRYVSGDCVSAHEVKRLADLLAERGVCVTETVMRALLADCALKLLISSGAVVCDKYSDAQTAMAQKEAGTGTEDYPVIACYAENELLMAYIDGRIQAGVWNVLIDDIIGNPGKTADWIKANREFFDIHYEYQNGEDVPGLLYMSIRDIGSRKAAGSYYTPTDIVRKMLDDVYSDMENGDERRKQRLLDPCCGTGNFLIQLPDDIELCNIYACDIDEFSVQLARFNLALNRLTDKDEAAEAAGIQTICENVACNDFLIKEWFVSEDSGEYEEHRGNKEFKELREFADHGFDIIIGNPPWGYAFGSDMRRYLKTAYRTAQGKGIESYDVFVERALELLEYGGALAFVLPEALLDVRNHSAVRQIIAESANVRHVNFVGDVFSGVQCPAVTLRLEKSRDAGHCEGAEIEKNGEAFVIRDDRPLDAHGFALRINDEEYLLLAKLEAAENCVCLKERADFALGIVTGDNKRYLSNECLDGMEPVVTGSDVYRYRYQDSGKYVDPDLALYQQAAPAKLYRAPEKLIYRFINRQLVFAYDDRQRLTLNSCNVVIPRVERLDMKYIMAVLNSRVAQYMYEKRYHVVKVLRSHIESIPIPLADVMSQQEIIQMADNLMTCENRCDLYDEIDDAVRRLYGVSDEDYEFIRRTLSGNRYML